MEEEKIGKYIRKLREDKGWTQDDLASELYISRQIISNIELGKMLPTHDKVVRLAKIFDVSILDIYSGEEVKEISSKETNKIIAYIESCLNSKVKKYVLLSIILFLLLLILFFLYYFFYTYNSVKIYQIYGESENFHTDQGLLVLTKENIYFKLNVLPNEDYKIDFINLKMKNSKDDKLIMRIDGSEIFIVDFYGYNSYFNYDSFIKGEDKLYLEIECDNDYVNIIDLNVDKEYENNNLFYKKESKKIKDNYVDNNDDNNLEYIPNVIKETFSKDGDFYKLKENNKTTIIYSTDAKVFSVQKENKEDFEMWDFDIDLKSINYSKFDKNWSVIEEKLNLNIDSDDERITYFIDNYYNKYLK